LFRESNPIFGDVQSRKEWYELKILTNKRIEIKSNNCKPFSSVTVLKKILQTGTMRMIPAVVQFAVFHQIQARITSQVPHPNQVQFHPSIQILILTLKLILPNITQIIHECKLGFYSF
jgi:hypothetical protein